MIIVMRRSLNKNFKNKDAVGVVTPTASLFSKVYPFKPEMIDWRKSHGSEQDTRN